MEAIRKLRTRIEAIEVRLAKLETVKPKKIEEIVPTIAIKRTLTETK
jgi:hypothetical protein